MYYTNYVAAKILEVYIYNILIGLLIILYKLAANNNLALDKAINAMQKESKSKRDIKFLP